MTEIEAWIIQRHNQKGIPTTPESLTFQSTHQYALNKVCFYIRRKMRNCCYERDILYNLALSASECTFTITDALGKKLN